MHTFDTSSVHCAFCMFCGVVAVAISSYMYIPFAKSPLQNRCPYTLRSLANYYDLQVCGWTYAVLPSSPESQWYDVVRNTKASLYVVALGVLLCGSSQVF